MDERKPENLPMIVIWEVKVVHWEEMNAQCSMDLMVVQRRLGFFEASFMRSRLAAANDEVISLFADEQAAR